MLQVRVSHICARVRARISNIDLSNVYYVSAHGLEMHHRHGSAVLYNRTICLSKGTWLLLAPAGKLIKIDNLPEDKAVVLDLGNVTAILVSRNALYGRTWTTYSVEVTFGKYFRFRRTIVLSLIKNVPVMVWSTDMPEVWIVPRYVYDDQVVIGTWFNYLLKCNNYTISIMYSNYTLSSTRIPELNIELPPGTANNGPKILQIDQRLFTGTCRLYVTDLPETSIATSYVVQSNYLKVKATKTEVNISSMLPIDHWTIYIIADGRLVKVENIEGKRSIVLKVRNYLKVYGHNIDVIVKAYLTCVGLCKPIEKTVIMIRR